MGYPERLLTEDESIVRQFHPHWRVLLLPAGWTLVAVAAVVVGVLKLDGAAMWAVIAASALAWLLLVTRPVVRWLTTQYVLTTERIVVRHGLVARTGREIPLENINDVSFSQSIVERMLGYGDVLIESAGETGQSRLGDIPDPEAFQSELYRIREQRALHFSGGGGGAAAAPRDRVAQLEALADLHERGALTDEEYAAEKRRLMEQS